jgi:hypothetical protein
MSGYSKVAFWQLSQGSGVSLVSGRARLLSVVTQGKDLTVSGTSNAVKSIDLKDGSSSGNVLYRAAFPAVYWASSALYSGPYIMNYQQNIGGDGILFENGIYFEFGSGPGSNEGIERLLLFYK